MKTTIENIYKNKDVFFKLIQCAWDTPSKSLEVYNFYCSIESQVLFFERERAKLAKLLGEPQENGKYKIKDENLDEFKSKLQELLKTEVAVNDLTISLSDVSVAQYTDEKEGWLTPIEIYKLDQYLKEQKEFNEKEQSR